MAWQVDTNNHGKEGEETKKTRRSWQNMSLSPSGQSPSFFQDKEIHLDLHQNSSSNSNESRGGE